VNVVTRLPRGDWGKIAAAAVLVVAVWVGIFLGVVKLLRLCYEVELLGPFLVDRLLTLLMLSFSGVLLLSNVVTSLAAFYLSPELFLVNAAPVSTLRLFYARFVETLVVSSWMVVGFGVPVVAAFGVVHHAPIGFYALSGVVAVGYVLLPAAAGVVLTTCLVNVFPARAARDLFVVVTAVFLGGAWILFRALRPERLVSPDSFSSLAQFLGSLAVPEGAWLPSTWAAAALQPAMRGNVVSGLPAAGFLLLWAAAFVVVAAWVVSSLYLGGWSKSQEGRPARLRALSGQSLQRVLGALLGRSAGAVLAKDVKVVARDATQWSQLVLLVALVAIYLFSIDALPFEALQFDTRQYRNAVAFLNIAMTGFVQAAVAVRFVYPAVSAEGRGIWILRTAPASAADIVRAKWLWGAIPVLAFGLVLAVASNLLLQTDGPVMVFAVFDAVLAALGICALAAGWGR
jgi:ABC-2 type transport system permease protein